jgi:hypothetical protein
MAAKDVRTNLSLAETSTIIAKETKRDSSAMKTISILDMVFLPGTFIAASFPLMPQ